MATTESGPRPAGPPERVGADKRRRPPLTALAAVGAVLAWFAVQLGRFVGDPPDLDAMVAMRESLVVARDGFDALIAQSAAGVHPPLLDLVSAGAFTVFGEDARSLHIVAIVLFAIIAASAERLLAPHLSPVPRVVAALGVAICPSLAIAVFQLSREGLMLAVLVPALALALNATGWRARLGLGALLALLPLIKETGLIAAGPFALYALIVGGPGWRRRIADAALVAAPVLVAAGAWRIILDAAGGEPWASWLLTPNADDGSYRIALNAMFMGEDGIFFRQNLANGLIVNWLWLPTALAALTLLGCLRRSTPHALRRAVLLATGVAVVYAWMALGFPTYTIPRYATPLTLLVVVVALLGLALWPRWLRPVVLVALMASFLLGAWSPTDPVSKAQWGTVSVAGHRIYDTTEVQRGPDRMAINFTMLEATEDLNERLAEVFASDASLVTGDCYTLKAGEKLYSIGLAPEAYADAIPNARPLACVPFEELPADFANGAQRIALLRAPEEVARGEAPALSGPSIIPIP